MESLFQDVRYGLRMLGKNPGFTAVALITLALGLGANISVFTLVNALLLRPPSGVPRPESLVDIYAYTARQHEHEYGTFSYPDYLYFREHSTVFSGLASEYPYSQVNLVANGNSRDINGSVVSDNYFSLIGLQPSLGRFFLPEEQAVPDRDAVAVLGFDLWRREFGSDPEIVGKDVRLNGAVFTVVGVGPREFGSLNAGGQAIDVWMPAMMFSVGFRSCNGLQRDCHPVRMIGRLKPGQTISGAEAEMNGLTSQLAVQYPDTDRNLAVAMAPLAGVRVMDRAGTEHTAKLLAGAVIVVLLIVSANLTGLLLARNHARKKEIAVRLAIGASPGRVVRQLLFETLPLSMLGVALGFVVALWAQGIFIGYFGLAGEARRAYFEIPFDFTVVEYSFGLAVITTLLFGMAPALQAGNFELIPALKRAGAIRQGMACRDDQWGSEVFALCRFGVQDRAKGHQYGATRCPRDTPLADAGGPTEKHGVEESTIQLFPSIRRCTVGQASGDPRARVSSRHRSRHRLDAQAGRCARGRAELLGCGVRREEAPVRQVETGRGRSATYGDISRRGVSRFAGRLRPSTTAETAAAGAIWVGRRPVTPPDAGGDAHDAAEVPVQMRLIGEPAGERNVTQPLPGGDHHELGALDSSRRDVCDGRGSHRLLECAREVTLAQGDAIRDLGALDLRAEMRLNVS